MQIRPIDRNEFISSEDKTLFTDAVIAEFLNNIRCGADWRTNILHHFHYSINEVQILRLIQYFRHFRTYYHLNELGDESHFDLRYLFYHQPRVDMVEHTVLVSIEKDPIWDEYRIVGVRLLHPKGWKVKKCLFRIQNSRP